MPGVVWYMQHKTTMPTTPCAVGCTQVVTKTPKTPIARLCNHNRKHKGYALATAYFEPLRMKAPVMSPRVTLGSVI